jgi:hypothetical protein
MLKVRAESITSEDDDSTVVKTGEIDYKIEYEKMAAKFESSKSLILKLQEKIRRLEVFFFF